MSLAIDREAIVSSYGGLAQPAYSQDWSYFGHEHPWTISQLGPWMKYDLQQAKQLMSAAGLANGLGRKASLWLFSPTGPQNFDIPALVADSWRRNLNLETELKIAQDTATWNRTFYGKQYEDLAAPPYLTLGAEPDEMSYSLLHSKAPSNYTFVNDPLLDDLCVKQGNALDVNERRAILKQIMDRDLDQMYRIFMVALNNILVRQPYVYNYVGTLYGSMNSIASQATQYLWLDQQS
jgi:ABC-type transport system substrate-binding protein